MRFSTFVTLVVCTLLLVLPFAHIAVADAAAVHDGPELTLVDAIELAFSYDLDHEIARLQWENARIDNMIAKASGPVSPYEALEREVQERRAENAYTSAHNTLVLSVVQQYFDVQQAAHQKETTARQAAIARQELEVVKQMVRIGERHPQDELREQNRVASAELSADNAARSFTARMAALLDRIGWEEDGEPVLVSRPEAIPFQWTLEETIAYALEHSFTVWERTMNARIAAMDFEALRVQNPAPLQLEKAENELRITELKARQAEQTFNTNVVSAYYSVVDAAKRHEAARVDFELAETAYTSAQRQHEVGLTTDIEREQAELDWLGAEQSYREAVTTYMRERLDLFNLIGHPLDVGEGFET